jgi:hypothetical protein
MAPPFFVPANLNFMNTTEKALLLRLAQRLRRGQDWAHGNWNNAYGRGSLEGVAFTVACELSDTRFFPDGLATSDLVVGINYLIEATEEEIHASLVSFCSAES